MQRPGQGESVLVYRNSSETHYLVAGEPEVLPLIVHLSKAVREIGEIFNYSNTTYLLRAIDSQPRVFRVLRVAGAGKKWLPCVHGFARGGLDAPDESVHRVFPIFAS